MLLVLILLCELACICSAEIHHHMTDHEIQSIFQVPRHEVPEYEVVPVFHKGMRDQNKDEQIVKLKAFDREIELYLKPTEGLFVGKHTPVYTVFPRYWRYKGLEYKRVRDAFKNAGKAYQDIFSKAALVLEKKIDGSVKMFGKLLDKYVIGPLPERLHGLLRKKRSLNGTDNLDGNHHILFKRIDPSYDEIHRGIKLVERQRAHRDNLHSSRTKRELPEIIYPEVLVIMDYELFKTQNKDLKTAILYLLAFWNAVDLRYRTMIQPRIRLNIAGFIISTEEGGTPFFDNYKKGREVDADKALLHMSKYFYEEFRFPFKKYDFVLAMTHLDLGNMLDNGYWDPGTIGYAYEAGACNRSSIDKNTEAVGVVEDNGGFSSIIPAAHEVAHLMGVPHDGTSDSEDCYASDGFIMSYKTTFGLNNFLWSNCTVRAFQTFFDSPDGWCLRNLPREDVQLERILPGTIESLDEQCEKAYGTKACKYDESVCTRLTCYRPMGGGLCTALSAAGEGSYCGENMRCLNSHCLPLNATLLPEPTPVPRPNWEDRFRGPRFHPSNSNPTSVEEI